MPSLPCRYRYAMDEIPRAFALRHRSPTYCSIEWLSIECDCSNLVIFTGVQFCHKAQGRNQLDWALPPRVAEVGEPTLQCGLYSRVQMRSPVRGRPFHDTSLQGNQALPRTRTRAEALTNQRSSASSPIAETARTCFWRFSFPWPPRMAATSE